MASVGQDFCWAVKQGSFDDLSVDVERLFGFVSLGFGFGFETLALVVAATWLVDPLGREDPAYYYYFLLS